MDDMQYTISLTRLLDEVTHDLDELRHKHPSDHGVKTITMWWDLERDRLVARHGPASAVKTLRRAQGFRRFLIWFFSGWATLLTLETTIRLLVR